MNAGAWRRSLSLVAEPARHPRGAAGEGPGHGPAGEGRLRPAPPGLRQHRHQRLRGDGAGRPPQGRHPAAADGGRRRDRPSRTTGPASRPSGSAEDLRPVLHHEGEGDRAGPLGGLRHRGAARRDARHPERAGEGNAAGHPDPPTTPTEMARGHEWRPSSSDGSGEAEAAWPCSSRSCARCEGVPLRGADLRASGDSAARPRSAPEPARLGGCCCAGSVPLAPPGGKVLGVTDQDLFIPILTYVFGEAQLEGAAAVVSTARLAVDVDLFGRRVLAERLAKEAVHELGHCFGLRPLPGSRLRHGPVGQRPGRRRQGAGALRRLPGAHRGTVKERAMSDEKTRILVVDDEEIVRESLGGWLEKDGYYVATAPDGAHRASSGSRPSPGQRHARGSQDAGHRRAARAGGVEEAPGRRWRW